MPAWTLAVVLVVVLCQARVALAQTVAGAASNADKGQPSAPFGPPQHERDADQPEPDRGAAGSERLRFGVRFLAGYGVDFAQAPLGLESHGRIGYAIFEASGRLSERLAYRFEINPVNESQPEPACGEEHFFFPNSPQNVGPMIACSPDGRVRVDDYKSIALDVINQQGPVRQAFLEYSRQGTAVRFGRFILPVGFGVEEAGSLTAKDATHIQRLNAKADFGILATRRVSRPIPMSASVAAVLGGGNRFHDYDYYYWLGGDLGTNSALTVLVSGTARPFAGAEIRAAYKHGYSGSNVERLPNYFASKRNDKSLVLSGRYRPIRDIAVFAEYANYTWGPTTSAALLNGVDARPIHKRGYYVGVDASHALGSQIVVGTTMTREELSRDDSLVKLLASRSLYRVRTGLQERSTVVRFYADINKVVRVGVYRNSLSNPFPWVSGSAPVSGPFAYQHRGSNKWGLVVRFILQ